MNRSLFSNFDRARSRIPDWAKQAMPRQLKRFASSLFWVVYGLRDFISEVVGWMPSHTLRLLCYRKLLGVRIGHHSSIHRNCRFYFPEGVSIGDHTVINRGVLMDGRMGLSIGSNVSISEGVALFSVEHDLYRPTFKERGATVSVGDYVFVGAHAIMLPGVTVGRGAVVGAGAVVTHDVTPFTIVAGVPARQIGKRPEDLSYMLDYRKFLG